MLALIGTPRRVKPSRTILTAVVLVLAFAATARATPYDFISVDDRIEEELRVLDMLRPEPVQDRIRLPHLLSLPLQPIELQGRGAPPLNPGPLYGYSLRRLERRLGRDRAPWFAAHPQFRSTPRVIEFSDSTQFMQISGGVEGRGEFDREGSFYTSGSGGVARIGVALDQVLAYARYKVAHFDNARTYADPLLPRTDFIILTEETYLSYSEPRGQWSIQYGQSKWHWGPGEEASLTLSKTMPALTGLFFRVHIDKLRIDLMALSATLRFAAGEQLAAHRIESQVTDGLRIGITEAARYKATGWRPLYLIGAIPYVLVQRLERQAEPDSLLAVRNNIITSADFTWRIVPGMRLYGELMIDDVSVKNNETPDKLAYQAGLEGVGMAGPTRLLWGGEYTRVSRFVYTSFFGRDHQTQGTSLGFPVAPDSRRLRLRANWDLAPDWQLRPRFVYTDKGEGRLDMPFVPPGPAIKPFEFEGVVQKTNEAQLGARWWPASGVDVIAMLGYRWIDNFEHVRGRRRNGLIGALEVRLTR